MRTEPMSQQTEALAAMRGREFFGLFMEQGTGKTWVLLADAERLYAQGEIDAVLVVAPKGVHTNWIRREVPKHMEGEVLARAWRKGGGTRAKRHMEQIFAPREEGAVPPLRIFSINIDALMTKDGLGFTRRFLMSTNNMAIMDESSRIKNPAAKRTNVLMALKPHTKYRRIATGTPITRAPTDVFSQMEFLESGLLGTTSYRSFVAEYTELVSNDSRMMKNMIQRNPKAAHAQIAARDPVTGAPRYRNLEKLQALLAPHTFRKLKAECLDLPPKIYQNWTFELTASQQKAYNLMESEQRLQLLDGTLSPVARLAAYMKLQQITSGFVVPPRPRAAPGQPPPPPPVPFYVSEENPRLEALMALLEGAGDSVIVWARFREEIRAIMKALRTSGITCAEYHGGVKEAEREAAVDGFQDGTIRVFVGNPQAGGLGLTLTRAQTVIYFSNDFNLETRLQSEDRAHRIGTAHAMMYYDIVADGTIDEVIAESLQCKEDLAAKVLGDPSRLFPSDN